MKTKIKSQVSTESLRPSNRHHCPTYESFNESAQFPLVSARSSEPVRDTILVVLSPPMVQLAHWANTLRELQGAHRKVTLKSVAGGAMSADEAFASTLSDASKRLRVTPGAPQHILSLVGHSPTRDRHSRLSQTVTEHTPATYWRCGMHQLPPP